MFSSLTLQPATCIEVTELSHSYRPPTCVSGSLQCSPTPATWGPTALTLMLWMHRIIQHMLVKL
jgi:hypothetical protein